MRGASSLAIVAILLAAARPALADARKDLETTLARYATFAAAKVWTADDLKARADAWSAPNCRTAIADARHAGVSGAARLTDPAFKRHPKASANGAIEVSDAGWICDDYAKTFALQTLRVSVQAGLDGTPAAARHCISALKVLGSRGVKTVDLEDGSQITLGKARERCEKAAQR